LRAIFDASVAVRALVDEHVAARDWLQRLDSREVEVSVPDLIFAEVGNALAVHVRVSGLGPEGAVARLEFLRRLPFDVRPLEVIAAPALVLALERDLSVYDACYAVLADIEAATLVTADARLARKTAGAELIR
jgi:predicted nucleic acid-binding protein